LVDCPRLLGLDIVTTLSVGHDGAARAIALDGLLRAAITNLGGGAEEIAAQMLFGVHQDARGRLLKDRRRLAADQFDVLPSTFRKNCETDITMDVAMEFYAILVGAAHDRPGRAPSNRASLPRDVIER
jgi:hypothetical protein